MTTDRDPALRALELAQRFHETYERMAPQFGYETRPDTRAFDPDSPNGRLMVAVCTALLTLPTDGVMVPSCYRLHTGDPPRNWSWMDGEPSPAVLDLAKRHDYHVEYAFAATPKEQPT